MFQKLLSYKSFTKNFALASATFRGSVLSKVFLSVDLVSSLAAAAAKETVASPKEAILTACGA